MPNRSLTALACAALSLVALLLAVLPAAAERRIALVLGNSTYTNSTLNLANPAYDAKDVAAALKELGFEVALESDTTRAVAEKAIVEFARRAQGADAALFFYAGHAVQHQGQNYLLPTDAEVTDALDLQSQTVQVENIRNWLSGASRGLKIIILDACRNNPVSERLARNAPIAAPLPLSTSERTRGLERVNDAEGLIIAYATSPGEVALDGQGRNSPFTKALLRRLKEPGLEVEMMFRRIAADVNTATGGRQRPETYVSLVNEYYLNQNDRIAWDQIRTTDDPAILHDFIERFPSSYFALEARYRLQALERAREEACRRDGATLESIDAHDFARINDLMRATSCAAVKSAARDKAAEAKAVLAREAEDCRREGSELDTLASAGKVTEIEQLRQRAKCPASVAAAESALRKIAAKLEAACARNRATLDAIPARDLPALQDLLPRISCDSVRVAAITRIDGIEAELAREAELCRREKADFDTLPPGTTAARIETFRRTAKCPATIAAIDQKLRDLVAAADAACKRDNQALERIGPTDLDALRGLASRTSCPQIRTSAESRIAKIEAEAARQAEACAHDNAAWKPLVGSNDLAGVEAFRRRVECPRVAAAIDQRVLELKAACRGEQDALTAIGPDDAAALRSFLGRVTCDEVQTAARAKLDKIETRLAAEEEGCRRESQSLASLRDRGADARQDLIDLRKTSRCGRLQADMDATIAALPRPERVNTVGQLRSAQTELRRLGCFEHRVDGKLDNNMLEGMNRYLNVKGRQVASLGEVKVTDDFVSELKGEKSDLCASPPPVIAKPEPQEEPLKPERHKKKEDVARLPPAEPPREEPIKPERHKKKEDIARLPPAEPPREKRTEPKPVREKPAVPAQAEMRPPRVEPKPARQFARPSYMPQAIPQASGGGRSSGGSSPIGVGF